MKKHLFCEAVAAIKAVLAILLLISGLMQFINPVSVNIHHTAEYSPRMDFLIPTLLSLPIFGISWVFNKKAQTIRSHQAQLSSLSEPTWQRRLKWFVFGIVVAAVLWSFLW